MRPFAEITNVRVDEALITPYEYARCFIMIDLPDERKIAVLTLTAPAGEGNSEQPRVAVLLGSPIDDPIPQASLEDMPHLTLRQLRKLSPAEQQ